MRIAVVGGTGTVGALAVEHLALRGHEVRILSRHAAGDAAGIGHSRVDLSSGEGVRAGLDEIEVVVDAANARPGGRQMRRVLVDGSRRLLAAGAEAGVKHHVLISIVGIDDVPNAYYRAKLQQERLVGNSPVPSSIVRATQFHQLLDEVFRTIGRVGVLPRGALPLQPVDAREVAGALADAVEAGPQPERREIAGPEVRTVAELARIWMRATGRRRLLVPLPVWGVAGTALRAGALTAPHAPRGSETFEHWLRER
jgi:uncharacterized protein YbjT (DUF2867 family)